ncbi:DL-endopeptidase inhibitor IseA family protein [Aneurinibacillus sp. REN35]|uniref:DL-endopeptidase inhibitor IseA family protein n=1 Tax=Aneurinibacillus sp. REN35 TaxID=3237286 RepID=UPI00352909BF
MKRPLLSLMATAVLLSPAVTMLDSKAMAAASSSTVASKQTEKSVKQRLLQERIQLLEKAIGSSITKKANGMSPTKRLAYLESILAPAVPEKAADIWAKGLKLRNGALQYAVLSPQLKKSRLSEFEKQNWITGVSSPWIEAYQIIKTKKVNATTFTYDIRFTLATSTGTAGSEDFRLTVQQYKKNWYVSQISLVTKNTVPAIKPLDVKSAALLAAQATIQYWYVASGGSGNEKLKTFTVNGLEYRYMSSDLDTKKEFINYLRKTYTAEAIATYMKQAKIIEHNGRLAQPNADGGSLLQWDKAQATLIRYANGIAEYELKVPYGEEGAIEFDICRIQLKYEKDGWKVNTPPGARG